MTETTSPRPLTAIGLLLVGAGLSAYFANPPGARISTFGVGAGLVYGVAIRDLLAHR